MGKLFDSRSTTALREFVSAPARLLRRHRARPAPGGHLNCSPRGLGQPFRVLGPLAVQPGSDFVGSRRLRPSPTCARTGPQIVEMFCAFDRRAADRNAPARTRARPRAARKPRLRGASSTGSQRRPLGVRSIHSASECRRGIADLLAALRRAAAALPKGGAHSAPGLGGSARAPPAWREYQRVEECRGGIDGLPAPRVGLRRTST
jgi:hypothetical protein